MCVCICNNARRNRSEAMVTTLAPSHQSEISPCIVTAAYHVTLLERERESSISKSQDYSAVYCYRCSCSLFCSHLHTCSVLILLPHRQYGSVSVSVSVSVSTSVCVSVSLAVSVFVSISVSVELSARSKPQPQSSYLSPPLLLLFFPFLVPVSVLPAAFLSQCARTTLLIIRCLVYL